MTSTIKTKLPWAILFAWLVVVAAHGSTWYANRITFGPGGFTNYTAAAIRYDLAAIIAVIICLLTNRTRCVNKTMLWLNLLAAVPMTLFLIGIYVATKDLMGGVAATILSLSGVLMLTLSALLGSEKIAGRSWVGTLLCLAGTGMIFLNKSSLTTTHGLTAQGQAVLIMLAATAMYSLAAVILKKKDVSDDAFTSGAVLICAMAILLSTVACFVQPGAVLPQLVDLELQPLVALLWQAIFSTLISYTALIYLTTRVSMPIIASLTFVTPLVAIAIDRFFERPELWVVTYTPTTFTGAALIFLGLVPVVWKKSTCCGAT